MSSELAAILVIYFVQGALGLARLAVTFRLKDELGLPPAEVAALMGLINIPWVVKPLYGFMSDAVPIFGSHRKSYLVLAGFVGSAAWTWLAFRGIVPAVVIAGATAASLAVAFADVVADSIVVERTRKAEQRGDREEAGNLQSACWLAQSGGSLATAYLSGSLLAAFSTGVVFGVTAVLPLLVSLFAMFLREAPVGRDAIVTSPSGSAGEQEIIDDPRLPVGLRLRLLWAAVTDRRVLIPSLVVFLFLAKPSAEMPFLYFLNNEFGFGPEMLGRLRLAESVACLAGTLIYRSFLRKVPARRILLGTTLGLLPFSALQMLVVCKVHRRLGIPDALVAFGDDVGLAALGQVAFMPTLVIAARLCPPGIEGTLFATLMSIDNLGRVLGQETGGLLTNALGVTSTDFTRLPQLLGICSIASLAPLPLLGLLKDTDAEDSEPIASKVSRKPRPSAD